MSWHNTQIGSLPRNNRFPFQVQRVYHCTNWVLPVNKSAVVPEGLIEFSLRLNATQDICRDKINGQTINLSFPHLLIKRPGDEIMITEAFARDTISFHYRASEISKLEALGLLPDLSFWQFTSTDVIENLIRNFRYLLYRLYSPGCPEKLDWVAFQLLRELVFQAETLQEQYSEETAAMKNIALWMQQHCREIINIEDLAKRQNMSRATFYRVWQRHFDVSPLQYIMDLRLQTAAVMLLETPFPASQIALDANFCSITEFYAKFKAKYGMTPSRYRKENASRNNNVFSG